MSYVILALSFLLFQTAYALNDSAQTMTIDGILYQAGTKNPLLDSNAKLTIQILNPAGTCILYEEEQVVSTSASSGYFSLQVGSLTGATKRTVNDPGRTMQQVFQNISAISANSVPGQTCAGGTYTPSAGHVRYFRVYVTPSLTNVADRLLPDITVDSVPAALVAQSVQGLERIGILQVNATAPAALTQSNLEAAFSGSAYTNLQNILAGNFIKTDTSGAALPSYASTPSGAATGDMWYDSTTNQIKYQSNSGEQIVGTSSGGVGSLTTSSNISINGAVAGTISSGAATIDLSNTGVTAGTYTKVTVDAKGRVSAGTTLAETDIPTLSTAGKVSGNTITSGTISGTAGINTSGNLVTTGTISGMTVQATNLRIYNGTEYAQLSAATMSGNVNFTWPATAGSAGQFLATDGNGVMSWANSSLPSLLDGKMWIGNGSNVATAVTLSGDATISNTGVLALNTVPISKGGTGTTSMAANRIVASNGTGSAYQAFTCGLNQVISFDASGNATCGNVVTTATNFSGDVSGVYNATSVDKIKGKDVVPNAYASGQVLRYNGTNWVNHAVSFADVISTPTTLGGYGITDAMSVSLPNGQMWIGNGSNVAAAVTMSGDAGISNAGVLTLINSGVTAGTYTKVTVDAKGRVTTGASLTAGDISTALTYTPLNKAGDTMTGTLGLYSTAADPATGGWGASEKGYTWFNSTSNAIKYWDGSSVKVLGVAGSGLTSLGGQTGASQTFAVGSAGTTLSISSASDVHTINIPMASTASVTAGLLSKADYDIFNAKLGTATQFAGDVSGTYNATIVQKLQGKDITAGSVSGQVMIYNGTQWVNSAISGDATVAHDGNLVLNKVTVAKGGTNATSFGNNRIIASNGTGSALVDFTCSLNQVISFDASGNATCSNVSALGGMIMNGGNTTAGTISIGTNDNHALQFKTNDTVAMTISQNGNVGIGTASPTGILDIKSSGSANVTIEGTTAGKAGLALKSNGVTSGYFIINGNWNGSSNTDLAITTTAGKNFHIMTNNSLVSSLTVNTVGNVGIGTTAPSSALDINGALTAQGLSSAPSASPINTGRIYYDYSANKFKISQNGGGYVDLVGAGAINSLGGQTGSSQSIAISVDNSVSTPTITSASDTHTWKIPMASNAGTTAGLLNKTDYDAFAAKLGTATTFSGDVSGTSSTIAVEKIRGKNISPVAYASGQTLRYDGTQWINQALDFADLGNKPTTLGGYGITDAMSVSLPNGQMWIGNGSNVAAAVTMSGDANIANTGIVTLVNSGVTAGTYTKVTVDAKGRVTTGASLTAGDISTALTYTPLNKAGDTMTGTLGLYSTAADPATGGWGASEKGYTWFNSTSNAIKYWDGSGIKVLGVAGSGLTSLGGQTGGSQTFAVGSSGTALNISSASDVHTINIPMASTASVTAGLLSKADYDIFNAKLGTTTQFAGDVSGTYNATITQKLQGKDITAGSVSGQIMVYDGTLWQNSVVSGDATLAHDGNLVLNKVTVAKGGTNATSFGNNRIIASNGTGSALVDFTCSLNQVISFDASGNATCSNVSALGGMILNGGNTTAGTISIGTKDNQALQFKTNDTVAMTISQSGNVGIGTTAPTSKLHVYEASLGANASIQSAGNQATLDLLPNGSYAWTLKSLSSASGNSFQIVESRWGAQAYLSFEPGLPNSSPIPISVKNNGNVGIGTNAPSTALDVSGALTARGMSSAPAVAPSNQGRIFYDYSTNKFKVSQNGGAYADLIGAGAINSLNGQTGGTQTFAVGTAGTALNISSASDVHTINIPMASTASVTAGLLSKADYDIFNAKLGTATQFAGDVSGTYNATIVQKLQGKDVTAGSVSGQIMVYDGTLWQNSVVSGDATLAHDGKLTLDTVRVNKGGTNATSFGNNRIIASNGTGSALVDFTCSLNQVISFDASGNATCSNISALAGMIMNGGNTTAGTISIGTNDNQALQFKTNNTVAMTISQSGNVGVGTTSPAAALDILGASVGSGSAPMAFRVIGGTSPDGGGGTYGGGISLAGGAGNYGGTVALIGGAGNAGGVSVPASYLNLLGGNWGGSGGNATLGAGNGINGSSGGSLTLQAGTGTSNGTGGTISLTGGTYGSGNGVGGNVTIQGGAKTGSGSDGNVLLATTRGNVGIGTTAPTTALDVSGAFTARGMSSAPAVAPANQGRMYFDYAANKFKVSENGGSYVNLVTAATAGSGTLNTVPRFNAAGELVDSGILDNGTVITASRAIASTTNPIASGAAVDLGTSNTHTLASVGGAAITISNQTDGGLYNIVVEDTTSRTYTFTGCTNSYFKPANAPTTVSTRTVYGLLTVKKGANWDCYITWSSGFQ